MTITNNPGAYADVSEVLDAAQAAGGAVYSLETEKAAFVWRARAYKLRKLLLDLKARELEGIPGIAPSTPYDRMVLTLDGCDVVIKFSRSFGKLKSLDGVPLDPTPKAREDRLMEEALAFASTLTGETE